MGGFPVAWNRWALQNSFSALCSLNALLPIGMTDFPSIAPALPKDDLAIPNKRNKRLLQRGATQPSMQSTSSLIEVWARVKPLLGSEIDESVPHLVDLEQTATDGVFHVGQVEGGSVKCSQSIAGYRGALLPNHTQEQAYMQVVPRLQYSFLNGYNCTLFVYGQTGSGKTHTLFGPPHCFASSAVGSGEHAPESWGMFPRCAMDLLAVLRTDNPTAVLNVSVVEVYLNVCHDLLNEKKVVPVAGFGKGAKTTSRSTFVGAKTERDKDGKWIPPWLDGQRNTSMDAEYEAAGQKVEQLASFDDVMRVSATVDASRSAKSHKLNERSSRSHCVITLTVGGGSKQQSAAKFLLVDLAGSERIGKSGVAGMQEVEARNVNSTLSALGRCVQAVSRREKYVPFRDSVLTMLMKQSLGGNCHTSLVVTVCADPAQLLETVSSLGFGRMCSTVANRADNKVNQITDRLAQVRRLQEALAAVNGELKRMEADGHGGGVNMEYNKATRDMFVENRARLEGHARQLKDSNKALEELRAAANTAGSEYEQAMKQKQYAGRVVNTQKGILIRMMMSGLYQQPKKQYLHRLTEKRRLVAALLRLGADAEDGGGEDESITMQSLFMDFAP